MRVCPRNNKLECFLKRSLSEERYERLQAYDSCIVDRKLRYLVLGDQCIYLTENPPRTLKKAVLYRNLKAAQQVCDFPDFLRGQERKDTLHIALIHNKRKTSKKSNFSSLSPLNSSRSSSSTSTFSNKRCTSSTGHFSPLATNGQPECHRKASLDEAMLHNLSRLDLQLHNCGDALSSSMPSKLLASHKQGSFPMADLVEYEATNLAQSEARQHIPLTDKCIAGCNLIKKVPSKKKSKSGDSKLAESFVKPQGEDVIQSMGTCRPLPQPSVAANRNRQIVLSSPSSPEQQECVLDVYMLSHKSPMLAIIRCAWENYLIRSTFQSEEDDDDVEDDAITEIQPICKQPELMFVQLKLEMLKMSPSNCSIEKMHTLCCKLQVYADTYFVVKRLFWKDAELFQLFIGILCRFSEPAEDKERSLMVQILSILRIMFRETENVPDRLKTLVISWQTIGDLLDLIAHIPVSLKESSLPFNSSNNSPHIQLACCIKWRPKVVVQPYSSQMLSISASDYRQDYLNMKQKDGDSSLSDLLKMFIAVLFEIFFCAQQEFFVSTSHKLDVVWMVNRLEETGCEELIEKVVDLTLQLTQPRGQGCCLSPAQVLQLYQQAYILLTLLNYSTKLTELICSNYFTEFKYLVQRPVLEQRIPAHYRLSQTLLTVIDKVLDKILN